MIALVRRLNPFTISLVALNWAAAVWYVGHGQYKLAALTGLYGAAYVVLGSM